MRADWQDLSWRQSGDGRAAAYVIEFAIGIKAVSGAFDELRKNPVVGRTASIALLMGIAIIGMRTLEAKLHMRGAGIRGGTRAKEQL